jgi:perosamine synthetase
VPTLSFIGSVNPVTYCGATPVFVDSVRDTWNLDPAAVERAVTRRTRAIIAVHLYGHPAHMEEILTIARRHGIRVIEDACEAHGGEYRGQKVGGLGTVGCFSFYANKIVTTGEGGMLVTNSRSIAENARLLRDHGMSRKRKYWHARIGFNYRMTNLQAALGVAQMKHIDQVIERKRRNAAIYHSLLKELPGLTLPQEAPWARHVYWLYTVLVEDRFKVSRKRIINEMALQGIETRPVFYPITSMPPYRSRRNQSFAVAERIAKKGLSLPSSPLLNRETIQEICSVIRQLSNGSGTLRRLPVREPIQRPALSLISG